MRCYARAAIDAAVLLHPPLRGTVKAEQLDALAPGCPFRSDRRPLITEHTTDVAVVLL
jgi:hypothetical protein